MSLVRFASRSASTSWAGSTPQLMRKAVRPKPSWLGLPRFALPAVAVVGSAILGCDGPVGPSPAEFVRPDVSSWVTPEVAVHLDASGHFRFSPPAAPTDRPAVGPYRAVQLAVAFMDTFVTNPSVITFDLPGAISFRESLENHHGQPINWDALEPAPWTPYYMEHPVQPIVDTIPGYVRRHLGPRYHVLFLAAGLVVADVAVSLYATDLQITGAGLIRRAGLHGGEEFSLGGIPASYAENVPLVPEAAVRDVAQATGARLAQMPRLLHPWNRFAPVLSRWQLRLNRPVDVVLEDTGVRVATSEVFVGIGGNTNGDVMQWFIAAPDQPTGEVFPIVWPPTDLAARRVDSLQLAFDPNLPTQLLRVRKR